jgi:P-type conjugative transfer protein TrbJ
MLGVGAATEWTQLANNLQLLLLKAQQVEAYMDQIKHTAKYNKLPLSQIEAHMMQFEQALQVGQSIVATMRNVDQVFRQRYPGYGPLLRKWPVQYEIWNRTGMDTMQAVLKAAQKQREKMAEETGIIKDLRDASYSAEGRMQVQQTQVQVASETLNQLVKLRELAMADLSAKTIYYSHQMQTGAAKQYAADEYFNFIEQNTKGLKKW